MNLLVFALEAFHRLGASSEPSLSLAVLFCTLIFIHRVLQSASRALIWLSFPGVGDA